MSGEKQGRDKASEFRSIHQLGLAPIEDILAIADLIAVDVICLDVGDEEHGLTARDVETGTSVIVVNNSLPSARFRSTVAHEVGHHLFGEDLDADEDHEYSSASETRAHAFARHLLLPLEAVKAADQEHPDWTQEALLNYCVKRYGVSPKIAAYQLNNARVIDADTCDQFAQLVTGQLAWKYGWGALSEERDGQVRRECHPRRLQELATEAYRRGRMSTTELAVILDSTVAEIEERVGVPEPAAVPDWFDDLGDDALPPAP